VGEAIGGLIVGSLGLVWWSNPGFNRQRRLEMATLVAGVIGISILCFYNDDSDWIERFQFSFVVFPSLVWAALRFGPHGTTLATLLIAVIALLGTVQGFGLFSFADAEQNLFLLQTYLAVISLTGLVLSSASIEQSENEAALREANEQLEHSVRSFSRTAKEARKANQKKSEFLALMSHELRNPLNGVVGFTSLLMNTDLTRAQRDHIAMIHSSGETLLGMIDEILDFNRIDSSRPDLDESPFSLRRLIGDVADVYRLQAERKGIGLSVDFPDRAGDYFYGDHQRIRQILGNLVGNAVKFTEAGSVSIRVREDDGGAAETPEADRVFVRVEVVDTGIGMEKEEADRLFAPFTQANQSIAGRFGGTGLGLVISKNLTDALGGRLDLESEAGKGSTFGLTVPLRRSTEADVTAREAERDAAYSLPRYKEIPPKKILIAEDNSTNQRVVQQLLERLGHESMVARDGREAIDLLKAESFDIVLLDIRMPGVDGYTVARAVREGKCGLGKRDLPIVAVTAHAMAEDKEKTRKAGMDGHLTKPFDLEKLAGALAEVVSERKEEDKAV
jgi:signal transduction histidine kinase/ActR/RegA family two-component response regulator